MSDGGKGSSPRPYSVRQEEFDTRWDTIFKKPDPSVLDDAVAEDEAFEFAQRMEQQRKTLQETKDK